MSYSYVTCGDVYIRRKGIPVALMFRCPLSCLNQQGIMLNQKLGCQRRDRKLAAGVAVEVRATLNIDRQATWPVQRDDQGPQLVQVCGTRRELQRGRSGQFAPRVNLAGASGCIQLREFQLVG